MSSKRSLFSVCLLIDLLCLREANAQPSFDSTLYSPSFIQAVETYVNSAAARDRLFSGPLYRGYDHQPEGYPFFMADTLLPGSVFYDGILFPGLRLSYDLTKDMVIMHNDRKDIYFQLMPERLPWFTVAGRRFVYLTADSGGGDLPSAGFYEELYHGRAVALAKHSKTIRQVGKTEDNLSRYRQYDYYYLQVGGRYYSIHSEASLLRAFGPDKALVRDFLKRSRLRYRKEPENTLKKAAEYYSQAKN